MVVFYFYEAFSFGLECPFLKQKNFQLLKMWLCSLYLYKWQEEWKLIQFHYAFPTGKDKSPISLLLVSLPIISKLVILVKRSTNPTKCYIVFEK